VYINIEKLIHNLEVKPPIILEDVLEINLPWNSDKAGEAIRAIEKYLENKKKREFIDYQGFLNILSRIAEEELEKYFAEGGWDKEEQTRADLDLQKIYIINLFLFAYAERENDFEKIPTVNSMTLKLFERQIASVVLLTLIETQDRFDKSKKAKFN